MGAWTHENLETQGYRLSPTETRRLRVGLRFPTALCLALVGAGLALFATGAATAALVLGGVLVAVCSLVTVTNYCIPSTMLAWLEARRREEAIA